MAALLIDPEFRDKIPSLSAAEFSKLEENIVAEGEVREPLIVWSNTIIDGHHRWQIIQKHPEIPYKVKQMEFQDKWAAIVWMCRNQLGRRNISEPQRMVLIAEQYEAQKKTVGAPQCNKNAENQLHQNDVIEKENRGTTGVVARQNGTSTSYVTRAVRYTAGLKEADKVSPGIKESLLSGEIKAPKKIISEIRDMPEEQKQETVKVILRGETVYPEYVPVKNAPPVGPRPEYNLEDFKEELMAVVTSLDQSFRTTLVLAHREMLDQEAGHAVADEVFKSALSVITKYQTMLKEVSSHAESI